MESQATSSNKGFFHNVRSNPWMLSTIVLILLLGFMVVAGGITGNAVFSGSKSSVGETTLEYLNAQVGGGVVLKSVEEESGLYKVTVVYEGQDIPVYVTKDGKNLVSSLVPLDGSASTTTPTSGPVDIDYTKLSHEPSIGSADAPVTIVEFSDFSCPFCGAASGASEEYVAYMKQNNPSWESPVQGIMENYVKSGKVRFILAYFPGHGTGVQAQLVGWCLNEQSSDAFWKYHDLVFAVQDKTDDLEAMKALAKQAGGNANTLNACLTAKKYDSYIQSDTDYGRSIGVSGTPAFYVNGQLVSGAVPFSDIQATIEAELAKSA